MSDLRLRPSRDQRLHLIADLRGVQRGSRPALAGILESADEGLSHVALALGISRRPKITSEEQNAAVISLACDSPEVLHQILACYVDVFSAWEICSDWAALLSAEARIPQNDDGAHLLGALGAVMAAERCASFEPFFVRAADVAGDPWDKFFFALRWATASLKRSGSRPSFEQACLVATRFTDDLGERHKDDRSGALLILGNLKCLALVMNREMKEATRLSESLVKGLEGVAPALPDNVWSRYCTTLRVNHAVATAAEKGPAFAVVLLKQALAACPPQDESSLIEVRALLALFLVRAGSPSDALPLIELCARSSRLISGVTQLREICRLAAVANFDLDQDIAAAKWFAAAEAEDPRQALPL